MFLSWHCKIYITIIFIFKDKSIDAFFQFSNDSSSLDKARNCQKLVIKVLITNVYSKYKNNFIDTRTLINGCLNGYTRVCKWLKKRYHLYRFNALSNAFIRV